MTFLILMPGRDTSALIANLRDLDPDLPIAVWPTVPHENDVIFAVTWNHPPGGLATYPNIRAASSYGAGIDHFLKDTELPEDLSIGRVVTSQLVRDMSRYLLAVVLGRQKNLEAYRLQQQQSEWKPLAEPHQEQICILGLGELDKPAAQTFARLGYRVHGWSRSPKTIEGVTCFHGPDPGEAVAGSHILICLLPLNPSTRGILNKALFEKTASGCFVINVGRGGHLNQNDLVRALEKGQLAGACLDVCDPEPLPPDHIFWNHPKIAITPHISAITDAKEVAQQLLESYRRVCSGKKPLHYVEL